MSDPRELADDIDTHVQVNEIPACCRRRLTEAAAALRSAADDLDTLRRERWGEGDDVVWARRSLRAENDRLREALEHAVSLACADYAPGSCPDCAAAAALLAVPEPCAEYAIADTTKEVSERVLPEPCALHGLVNCPHHGTNRPPGAVPTKEA